MPIVTNTGSVTPIGLPGGVVIAPGQAVDYPNWSKVKERKSLAHYVSAGVLQITDEVDDADAGDQRQELFAKLKALGIDAQGNSKVETLQKKLDEALAAQAAAEIEAAKKQEVIIELKGLNVEFDETASLADLQAALATAKA